MNEINVEARAFLKEFQQQPDEVRKLFLYAICQTMDQAGLLELLGAFTTPGVGTTLLYRNPDTGEVFEIIKPRMSIDEEQAMQAHIGELLQENARKAV